MIKFTKKINTGSYDTKNWEDTKRGKNNFIFPYSFLKKRKRY